MVSDWPGDCSRPATLPAEYQRVSKSICCTICGSSLDMPGRPWTRDCGGDCLACMAEAGDRECVDAIAAMRAGEIVVKAARDVVEVWFTDEDPPGSDGWPKQMFALRGALPPESEPQS